MAGTGNNSDNVRIDHFCLTESGSGNVDELHLPQPLKFSILQNYFNPFNPTTNIIYFNDRSGLVNLKIYDLLGKEV